MGDATFHQFFIPTKHWMSLTGLWPHRKSSLTEKLGTVLNPLLALVLTINVPEYKFSNLSGLSAYFIFICFCGMYAASDITVHFLSKNKLRKMLNHLENQSYKNCESNFSAIISKRIVFLKYLNLVWHGCSVLLVAVVQLYPDAPNNEELVQRLRWVVIKFVSMVSVWNFSCLDCCFNAAFIAGVTQLEILRNMLEQVGFHLSKEVDAARTNKVKRLLDNFVIFHVDVARYINLMDELFRYRFLNSFVITSALVSMLLITCVQAAHGDKIRFFVYALLAVNQLIRIIIWCAFGQIFINMSTNVGNTCYMLEWNKLNSKVCKNVCMIIQKCQTPCVLTAGKFLVLSHETSLMVFKATFTYFNLLLQFYGQKDKK